MRLSRAGELYLRDYYILDEARKSVHAYLDSVIDQIELRIKDSIQMHSVENTEVGTWRNGSSVGEFCLWIKCLSFTRPLTINVWYRDARTSTSLDNPATTEVSVRLTGKSSSSKSLEEVIKNECAELTIVETDLDDSSKTGDTVSELMLDLYNKAVTALIKENQ